jgi:hypothetical protein
LFDSGEGLFLDFRGNKIAVMEENFFEGFAPDEQILKILPVDDALISVDSKSNLTKYTMLFTPKSVDQKSEDSSKTGSLSS